MKVYLDTTVLIAYLFGELSDTGAERQAFASGMFEMINIAADIEAFVSLYSLQELAIFAYDNYASDDAPTVLRLAVLMLFQNEVTLLPLLDRIETLRYRRLVSIPDRSDQPHVALAMKYQCDCILAYDEHFARASLVNTMTPDAFVEMLKSP